MRLIQGFAFFLLVAHSGCLTGQTQPGHTGKEAQWRITPAVDFELQGDTALAAWTSVAWKKLGQREPLTVRYETKAKMLYSDKGIYTLFWCEDKKITASLTQANADLYREDVVEIFFWTDERFPLYFEYELSPLNNELILLVPNFDGKFLGWIPWHYEGERQTRHMAKIIREGETVKGWVAEFFIPYALLQPLNQVPPVRGTQWRMNLYRIDYDQGSTGWWWQPVKTNFHDIHRFGTLVFD
jgi:hypothetical protein